MRKRLFSAFAIVAAVLLCPLSQSSVAAPPQLPGWDVSWFDEFDGNSVDTSKWDVIFSTQPTNNSRQAYLPDQVTVGGGNLVITATNQPYGNLPFRSGQVISKSNQRHGKWEVRADLPTSRGHWPAIWLLPDTNQYNWPSQGEIDIMENRGDQQHTTSSAFHYGSNPPYVHNFVYSEQNSHVNGNEMNFHSDFHTYGVEWSSDVLRFFVDGVNYYNVHNADVGGFLGSQWAGMETVINNAIGGDFLDNPDGSSIFPQQMLIDYVHVYDPATTPAPLVYENGSFEGTANPDHSLLAGWTTFGTASFGNVSVHQQAVLSGSHSLKLFGKFEGEATTSGVEQGITVTGGEELRAIANEYIRSNDSIAGTDNQVYLKIDYYSKKHGAFGSSDYISSDGILIADGATANNTWLNHELRSTAPAGAVEARMAITFVQPGQQGGAVHIDDTLFGRRGDNVLTWDGNGNGVWDDARWLGTGPVFPSDFDRAVIRDNRVVVVGNQHAFETVIESGELLIAGQLSGDVKVEELGSVKNRGNIVGDLAADGTLLIESVDTLSVSGAIVVGTSADLTIGDSYSQARGTYTGSFAVVEGSQLQGSFQQEAGDHLGEGIFLESITYNGLEAMVNIYSALPADANGDGTVDGADFLVWNAFKFQSGTDWTTGDFNGDGITDGGDFLVWNGHKFTSADVISAVPEPRAAGLCLLVLAYSIRRRFSR